MFEKLFDKKIKKARKIVEDDLRYAERMMCVYHREYKENPSDLRAKEQYDFWRGKHEAFKITQVVIKDLCENNIKS